MMGSGNIVLSHACEYATVGDSAVELQDTEGVIYTYTSAVIFTHSSNNIPHSHPAIFILLHRGTLLVRFVMGRSTKEETRHRVEKERRSEVTAASVRWHLSPKDCSNNAGMQAIFVGCRGSANEALERRKVKLFPDLLNSSSFHIYFYH